MEQRGSNGAGFGEIWYLNISRKTFERIQLSLKFNKTNGHFLGTAVAQWLRCCATNRKVAGSIPAGVIGIFH